MKTSFKHYLAEESSHFPVTMGEAHKIVDDLFGHEKKNVIVQDDYSVIVKNMDVNLSKRGLVQLPLRFDWVTDDFWCHNNSLTSLEGSPKKCLNFNCQTNSLTSFVGSPRECSNFTAYDNSVTSIEGMPEIINGRCDISQNKITSLHNIHKVIRQLNGTLYVDSGNIKSCVLGLLLIPGQFRVGDDVRRGHGTTWKDIINRHQGQGKNGVMRAQGELIDAGYRDLARL